MHFKNILLIAASVAILCTGMAAVNCNSTYVKQAGPVFTVFPTNADDTANLQCAFDEGSKMPGVIVQLAKGTYITDRIVAKRFNGIVRGAGIDSTIIRNPNYPILVTPDDFYMTAPDAGGQYPYLFVFLGGDYTITDLTVSIVGDEPATDWSIFGIRDWLGHGIKSLAGPFVILGSPTGRGYRHADAAFNNIKITGQATSDPLYGYNIYNGIFYEGFVGPELQPLKGRFTVVNSVFDSVASPAPVSNLVDSWVSISGNTLNNVYYGSDLEDLKHTFYEFAHNKVTGVVGLQMYDNCFGSESICGMQGSTLIVKNNRFRGTFGVLIDATFGNQNSAFVAGNNFKDVSDLAVRLGPNTSRCLVIGAGHGTAQDLGTGNVIVGMKRIGGGNTANAKSMQKLQKHH